MNWRKALQYEERGEAGTVRSWDGGTGRGHFPFADLEKSGSRCSNNLVGLREDCLSS